ncbi:MAG: hypothetical protein ABIT20_05735 [Gemmatimonadaceae bacterium]
MKRSLMGLLLGLAITIGTLCILEGVASALLFVRDFRNASASKALIRPHTVHDTLLGWTNRPSFSSPNEYGDGIALTTTSLGLRGDGAVQEPSTAPSAGLVCSGDAFTLGYGVADDRTWCAMLGRTLSEVHTYNMGEADYGLDQSVLRYKRDAGRVAHQTQVLGITNAQLERMTSANNAGRPKPTFALDGDKLITRNVPVPETTTETLRRASRERVKYDLRTVQAFIALTGVSSRARDARRIDDEWTLVEKTLDDAAAANASRGSRLVLAYLPAKVDLRPSYVDERRKKLAAYAQRRGITLIDLTTAMRGMRPDSVDLSFISRVPRGAAPGVANQYSNLGHAWIARMLAPKLFPAAP